MSKKTTKKVSTKGPASKKSIKKAAESEPSKEDIQAAVIEIMRDERKAGVDFTDMSEKDRHAAMSHREKMAIQNARAKRKFSAVNAGMITIPDSVKGTLRSDAEQIVIIDLPCELKINQRRYGPGQVRVPRHLADTMIPMAYKKTQADLAIFTGKNYRVQRVGGKMVRTELPGNAGLDIKKLVSS